MARKKIHKDNGVLEYISPKNRKKAKALIRAMDLKCVSVTKLPDGDSERLLSRANCQVI